MSLAPAFAYAGRTVHIRFTPFERRFSYRLSQILIDIDRVAEAARGLKLFSYNRPNLTAFYDKDHGDRSGAPLRPWAEAALAEAGVRLDGGPIRLLTFPRIFNYVFNPISVYFGHGPDEALRGVLFEVNNTFGDTHTYAAAYAPHTDLMAAKRLHVSPFFDVAGGYRFRLGPPGASFSLTIENIVAGARTHLATLRAKREPLTDARLARAAAALPFMTAKVTAAIHWQALHLWLKGAGYRSRPAAPRARVSSAAAGPALPDSLEIR